MTSNNALAKILLKADRQAMSILTNVVYDLLKSGGSIGVDELDSV
jgi:type I restriction enzyme R subunit